MLEITGPLVKAETTGKRHQGRAETADKWGLTRRTISPLQRALYSNFSLSSSQHSLLRSIAPPRPELDLNCYIFREYVLLRLSGTYLTSATEGGISKIADVCESIYVIRLKNIQHGYRILGRDRKMHKQKTSIQPLPRLRHRFTSAQLL